LGWTASPQTIAGCNLTIELRVAGDAGSIASVEHDFDSAGARQSAEDIGELRTGDYQLHVVSTCEAWTAVVSAGPPAPSSD
jgi:hypothetical protein